MHLAQDNDVVHTLTPDRSDQPFHKAILPRRGRRGRPVPDAHGAQSARDDAAIDPVAIAMQALMAERNNQLPADSSRLCCSAAQSNEKRVCVSHSDL